MDKKDNEIASGKAISLSPLNFYQNFISPVDGARCQMWPSCSDYAKLAVENNGKFKGILMTFDRLTRCGSDLHKYDTLHLEGRIRFYDYPGDIKR